MNKLIYVATLSFACLSAVAAPACDGIKSNWAQSVCNQAVTNMTARKESVTPTTLQAEMKKVEADDTNAFVTVFNAGGEAGGAMATGSAMATFTAEDQKAFESIFNSRGPNGGAISQEYGDSPF